MSSKLVWEMSTNEARSVYIVIKILVLMGIYLVLYEMLVAFSLIVFFPDYIQGVIENLSETERESVDLSSDFDMVYSFMLLLPAWFHFSCLGLTLAHFLVFPKPLRIGVTVVMVLLFILLFIMNTDGSFKSGMELLYG